MPRKYVYFAVFLHSALGLLAAGDPPFVADSDATRAVPERCTAIMKLFARNGVVIEQIVRLSEAILRN